MILNGVNRPSVPGAVLARELATVPLFATLGPERLAALSSASAARRFERGDVVLHRGRPASRLVALFAGVVAPVADHHDGTRSRLRPLTAPCLFDKAAGLVGGSHKMDWTVLRPARGCYVDAAAFRQLFDEEPTVRDHVVRYLACETDRTRDTFGVATGSSTQRVARWLLSRQRAGESSLLLPAGQQGMAEEIGISRVAANRALQTLVQSGFVRTARGRIEILDPDRLRAL